ncbi:MAG: MFS transporter [Pseudobutyrivibrio sp.]|nr:MFS transporter [Pseudobutyrivibrio sp.]
MAVSSIGTAVNNSSNTNVTVGYDNVQAYVIEMDEAGVATSNILELTTPATVNVTADNSEIGDNTSALSFNENNTKFTVTIGDKTFNNDNCEMDFTKDAGESYEVAVAIYVSAADYADISEATTCTADLTSTKQVERYGFKYFSLIIAILFVAFITITCVVIKEKSTVDVKTPGVGEMFKSLIMNDQAMTMVITIVLVNSATYITSNLLIYFFKYDLAGANWEANYTLFNTFAGGIQIIAMMIFFPILRKFFNTMKIFDICILSGIVGYIVLLCMALGGVGTVYPFLLPGFLIMAAVGILNVIVTVFLANTVDYGELKNGRRDESVIFSMQTFVVKLASGVAALIASIALSVFHISDSSSAVKAVDGSVVKGLKEMLSQIASKGAAVVSNNDIVGLRLTMTLAPIFVLIIAFAIFKSKYILTDEKLAEISDKLHNC